MNQKLSPDRHLRPDTLGNPSRGNAPRGSAPGLRRIQGPALLSLLLFLSASVVQSKPAYRLPDDVQPRSQTIALRLDPEQERYTGRVDLQLEVTAETSGFALSAEAMDITALALTREDGLIETSFEFQARNLRILSAEPLPLGAYTLSIEFEDDYNTNAVGLYRVEHQGDAYLFTQFEADDAREAFPCFDEPEFKIPYQLILEIPEGLVAVSNTPVEENTASDGWKHLVFAETKPLPSYLLALAVGPFDSLPIEGMGVPGRIYTVNGQSHLASLAAELTPPILKELERYFDRPYPYAKLDFLAVPEFWPGAMEHPGAITYADGVLLVETERSTVNQKRRIASIVAHELAHQWFGNLVTLEWWDDLWLNEAFADWMGDKVTHRVYPEFGADLSSARGSQQVMVRDALATTRPVRSEVASTDNILQSVGLAYNKGKGVLSMFEHWIGDETFRAGVLAYMDAYEWGNAQSSDLWATLAHVSRPELPAALATFIEQPGFPMVEVERRSDGTVGLRQSRFHNAGSELEPFQWKIPLVLKYPAPDGGIQETEVFLTESEAIVDLNLDAPPSWILPKGGGFGYFRYRLERDVFQELATVARAKLTPHERLDFVGNLGALFDAGDLHGADYLQLIETMGADPETEVVRLVLEALQRIKQNLVTPELSDAFAAYVRRTLQPAVERFGIDPRPGEPEVVAILRPSLLRWAAEDGASPPVIQAMQERTRAYLENGRVDPLLDTALRVSAGLGDLSLFRTFRQRFESATLPEERRRFLGVLGRFRSPTIRQEVLEYALTGPLRSQEIQTIWRSVAADESGRDQVFAWFAENYPILVERTPPIQHGGFPRVASGCSQARLLRGERLFAQEDLSLPGTKGTMDQVREAVENCLALRSREGDSVTAYLRSTARDQTRLQETSEVLQLHAEQGRPPYPWLDEDPWPNTQRIEDISPPAGFDRLPAELNSFAAWLRGLPLRPEETPVRLFHGGRKPDQSGCFRVLDIDTGSQDLQQCADAVIRLRGEYLYWKGALVDIGFNFTSGDRARFDRWMEGYRPKVRGNSVEWNLRSQPDVSYNNFKNYLKTVFTYAGSWSLDNELAAAPIEDIRPGDVFIEGGFPGHAMIVVDVAEATDGRRAFLLAQSYMPAQDMHIVHNPGSSSGGGVGEGSPWFVAGASAQLETPDWSFDWSDLRRFR